MRDSFQVVVRDVQRKIFLEDSRGDEGPRNLHAAIIELLKSISDGDGHFRH